MPDGVLGAPTATVSAWHGAGQGQPNQDSKIGHEDVFRHGMHISGPEESPSLCGLVSGVSGVSLPRCYGRCVQAPCPLWVISLLLLAGQGQRMQRYVGTANALCQQFLLSNMCWIALA